MLNSCENLAFKCLWRGLICFMVWRSKKKIEYVHSVKIYIFNINIIIWTDWLKGALNSFFNSAFKTQTDQIKPRPRRSPRIIIRALKPWIKSRSNHLDLKRQSFTLYPASTFYAKNLIFLNNLLIKLIRPTEVKEEKIIIYDTSFMKGQKNAMNPYLPILKSVLILNWKRFKILGILVIF